MSYAIYFLVLYLPFAEDAQVLQHLVVLFSRLYSAKRDASVHKIYYKSHNVRMYNVKLVYVKTTIFAAKSNACYIY